MRFRGEEDSFHLLGRIAGSVSVVVTADLIRPDIIDNILLSEITRMITNTAHMNNT